MPSILHILGHNHILQYYDSVSGLPNYVGFNMEPYVTVEFVLNSLRTHAFTSWATMFVQGYMSALMLVGDADYVFKQHSRCEAADQVPFGTAVLLKFNTCEEYCSYLENMWLGHENVQFDFTQLLHKQSSKKNKLNFTEFCPHALVHLDVFEM